MKARAISSVLVLTLASGCVTSVGPIGAAPIAPADPIEEEQQSAGSAILGGLVAATVLLAIIWWVNVRDDPP